MRKHIKQYLIFTLTFMAFAAIGTVSHEYGHIIVAQSLGYETTLHYGSMHYANLELTSALLKIVAENKEHLANGTDFKQKAEYVNRIEKFNLNELLITIGGPLQTILTGTIGFFILLWRRKKIREKGVIFGDWVFVFLSLFWLREVFNLLMSVSRGLIRQNGSYFGGDENKISFLLNVWSGSVPILLGVIGLTISTFVIFKVIPKTTRTVFIVSGFIGGASGFALWMNVLGPKLLP